MTRAAILSVLVLQGCLRLEPTNPLDPANLATGGYVHGLGATWSDRGAELHWDTVDLEDLAYNLYRQEKWYGGWESLTVTPAPPFLDGDTSLVGLNYYQYSVTARGTSGRESRLGPYVEVITLVDPLDDEELGNWTDDAGFDDGALALRSTPASSIAATALIQSWADHQVEVVFYGAVGPGDEPTFNVFFRSYWPGENGYVASITEERVRLHRMEDGSPFRLAEASIAVDLTATNTVQVTALGPDIGITVNGTLVIEATDYTYSLGHIGFGAEDSFDARVDSLSVFQTE